MALTLAESAKLSTDMILAGVIETVIKEEHILDQLPFVEVVGNSFVYNRLNTEPTVSFLDVGDTWTEDTPDFTQLSVQLKILGGDADVDNFIQASRVNVQDIEGAGILQKAKALARKWEDTFINGDTAVDADSFDGLDKLIADGPAGQTVSMGTNGGTLTLARLDELIDAVKTRNIVISMSRRSASAAAREPGSRSFGGRSRSSSPASPLREMPSRIGQPMPW